MTPAAAELRAMIERDGPLPLARYMAWSNAAYYASRDPLGLDFTTAPEVSQIFGELVGVWLTDLAERAGALATAHLVELGPGRGTLMADALRVARRFGFAPRVHFVETSPVLRAAQRRAVPNATWHDDLDALPAAPVVIVANEFLDCLPVRQFERTPDGWRERVVGWREDRPAWGLDPHPADALAGVDAPPGAVVETCPAATATVEAIAAHLVAHGGAALVIDYGTADPAPVATLQALAAGQPVDPLEMPGEADLTAHVDFGALVRTARAAGTRVHGPVPQRDWLDRLGLAARTDALAAARPGHAATIRAGASRLADRDAMGTLFQVLALTAPGWPAPAGFA